MLFSAVILTPIRYSAIWNIFLVIIKNVRNGQVIKDQRCTVPSLRIIISTKRIDETFAYILLCFKFLLKYYSSNVIIVSVPPLIYDRFLGILVRTIFLRPFRPKLLVLFQTPLFNQLGSINDQRGLLVRLVFRLSSLRKLNFILLIFVIRQRNFNTNSMIILLEGMLNSNRWNYASQVIRYCRILQAKNIFRLKI